MRWPWSKPKVIHVPPSQSPEPVEWGGPRIGSMRVGEAIQPIESIRLARHCLLVTAKFPFESKGESGPVTLYTPEGEEFSSGQHITIEDAHGWPVLPSDTFEVTYRLNITHMNGIRMVP